MAQAAYSAMVNQSNRYIAAETGGRSDFQGFGNTQRAYSHHHPVTIGHDRGSAAMFFLQKEHPIVFWPARLRFLATAVLGVSL